MSVPEGGSTPADNPPPSGDGVSWPQSSPSPAGAVPVLSRSAHDRSHLARMLPDPTGGRPVQVLTVDQRRTVPVEETEGGPRLMWEERRGLPEGAVYLGEADVATEVTGPAFLETWYELGRMALAQVSEEELDGARRYVLGSMALSTATHAGLASTLSALAGSGLPPQWLAEHQQALARVTVEEVQEAARRVLQPAGLTAVVVGDAGQVTDPLHAFGPVEVVASADPA